MSTFLQRFRSSSKAFTVIELMLVVGVITILTGVFLLQQRQFDSTTLLRSLAYRTALSVREAQTFGTSVRFAGTGTNYKAATAYGVHFSASSPTTYYLFADADGDRARAADGSEDVDTFILRNNFRIGDFSATAGTTASSTLNGGTLTSLTIIFIRPSTDACFRTTTASVTSTSCPGGATSYTRADVRVSSPGGATRSIVIYNTGQISVNAPSS